MRKKNIVITGVNRGLGFYIAQNFLNEGHNLILLSRTNNVKKELILSPNKGSNLMKAGLSGDAKLTFVNKVPVKDFRDLYKFLKTKKDGDSVTITVEQNKVVKDYTFDLEVWEVLGNDNLKTN